MCRNAQGDEQWDPGLGGILAWIFFIFFIFLILGIISGKSIRSHLQKEAPGESRALY